MPTKAASKNKADTEVILVVKGAGDQLEDDHLNLFLRGFWPAIKSLDSEATIAQVKDELKDYQPSPHNKEGNFHKHLTEIHASLDGPKGVKRRIWVKETYWEAETLPSNALSDLFEEWDMSSFVFANMFQDILFTRNTRALKRLRMEQKAMHPKPGQAPGTRFKDYLGNYVSYLALFLFALLPALLMIVQGASNSQSWFDSSKALYYFLGVAAIWALGPAFEVSRIIYARRAQEFSIGQELRGLSTKLPGLPAWILIVLMIALVLHPIYYVGFLLLLLGLQITTLLARRLLWNFRQYETSDVDTAEYYPYEEQTPDGPKMRNGKVDRYWFTRIPFSPLFYRYLIFLTLPLAFIATYLVKFLKWTRLLGGLGDGLEVIVRTALVGFLADVVNYAKDPAQAQRVRSAVKDDIVYFDGREEVKRIHIIAHSQGTPITFETLFQFLEAKYQKKISTYVTIGSVLSYYHQGRGTLDPIYYNRFEVPIRDEKEYKFYDGPDGKFRWMNFWNFTDPITEFYGLDEYTWYSKFASNKDKPNAKDERSDLSPVNIRTRSSVKDNHGEYWNNIDQVHAPFAERVLGRAKPKAWTALLHTNSKKWHHAAVVVLWLLLAVLYIGAVNELLVLLRPGHPNFLSEYFAAVFTSAQGVLTALFPPAAEPRILQSILDPTTFNLIKDLATEIFYAALVVLGVIAVVDWAKHLGRALSNKTVKSSHTTQKK